MVRGAGNFEGLIHFLKSPQLILMMITSDASAADDDKISCGFQRLSSFFFSYSFIYIFSYMMMMLLSVVSHIQL